MDNYGSKKQNARIGEKEIMKKSELIEINKNLLQQNGSLMYLLEFGELRSEDSNHQMIWKHDSNARLLQHRIDKAIKYIEDKAFLDYERETSHDLYDAQIFEIIKILRGENNE